MMWVSPVGLLQHTSPTTLIVLKKSAQKLIGQYARTQLQKNSYRLRVDGYQFTSFGPTNEIEQKEDKKRKKKKTKEDALSWPERTNKQTSNVQTSFILVIAENIFVVSKTFRRSQYAEVIQMVKIVRWWNELGSKYLTFLFFIFFFSNEKCSHNGGKLEIK